MPKRRLESTVSVVVTSGRRTRCQRQARKTRCDAPRVPRQCARLSGVGSLVSLPIPDDLRCRIRRVQLRGHPERSKTHANLAETVPAQAVGATEVLTGRDGDSSSLNALDQRIAELERLAAGESGDDSSSDDSDGDDESDSDSDSAAVDDQLLDNPAAVAAASSLERIVPLPAVMTPEGFRAAATAKRNESKKKIKDQSSREARSNRLLAAATASKWFAEKALEYETAEGRSMYCRVCKIDFETVEELQEHRASVSHLAAESRDRQRSHCPLCDKSFTSPAQLREHVAGKVMPVGRRLSCAWFDAPSPTYMIDSRVQQV